MKEERHAMIVAIIKEREISTQEELGDALKEKGILVTQATLSRDIKELGLIKVPILDGDYRYSLPSDRTPQDLIRRAQRMLEDTVEAVDLAENLIVIKTTSGTAQGVAQAVDDLKWPEMVGTVAGDNTILAIIRTREQALKVFNRLNQLRG